MNICIQLFVGTYIFVSLGLIPMSGITGSYDGYMFILKKNCQIIPQSTYFILHFYQQYMRVPVSPPPH